MHDLSDFKHYVEAPDGKPRITLSFNLTVISSGRRQAELTVGSTVDMTGALGIEHLRRRLDRFSIQ